MTFLPSFKTLHITQRATKDLQNIATYTQQTWGARQKRKYLAQLHQGFQALCLNSDLGNLRDESIQGMQSFSVERHIIFLHRYCRRNSNYSSIASKHGF